MTPIRGAAHVFGDNVDTDVIIPARYLTTTDAAELGTHCMEGIDETFSDRVNQGDILVAGSNFGSGSSREHAPVAIRGAGISCVVASSFARIFFRNAFNVGLPIVECPGIVAVTKAGDELEIELGAGVVRNLTQDIEEPFTRLPAFMTELLDAGGLVPYLRTRLSDAPKEAAVIAAGPKEADFLHD